VVARDSVITLACRSICNIVDWQGLVSGFTCRSQTYQDQLFPPILTVEVKLPFSSVCTILPIKVITHAPTGKLYVSTL